VHAAGTDALHRQVRGCRVRATTGQVLIVGTAAQRVSVAHNEQFRIRIFLQAGRKITEIQPCFGSNGVGIEVVEKSGRERDLDSFTDAFDCRARNLEQWSRVTAEDIAHLAGEREELMRVLKDRYQKSYGEIEREVAEFELRDLRAGYASRPALGIGRD